MGEVKEYSKQYKGVIILLLISTDFFIYYKEYWELKY